MVAAGRSAGVNLYSGKTTAKYYFIFLAGTNKETLGLFFLPVIKSFTAREKSHAAKMQPSLAPPLTLTFDTVNMLGLGRGEPRTIQKKKKYDDEGE